ncbi:MAG: hypothetical protein JJU00_20250 [Opitutales bacterium]|nr:hypothetical protein [Opitutales bacterium]
MKTSKTAGTSLEIALSQFCGENDIISPIQRKDERIRVELGYPKAQNYLAPLSDYSVKDIFDLIRKRKRKVRFFSHISAKEASRFISPEIWNSYFKFCFERSPWERVISAYYWKNQSPPRPTISDFLTAETIRDLMSKGKDIYTINNNIVVDRIFKYEELEKNLDSIRKTLMLPSEIRLPMAKAGHRKDHRDYTQILTPHEIRLIGDHFKDVIDLMDY